MALKTIMTLCSAVAVVYAAPLATPKQSTTTAVACPKTVTMDGETLVQMRALYDNADTRHIVQSRVSDLLEQAEVYIKRSHHEKWSVTNSYPDRIFDLTGFSTSPHDYVSTGPYWWASKDAPCKASVSSSPDSRRGLKDQKEAYIESLERLASGAYGKLTADQMSNIYLTITSEKKLMQPHVHSSSTPCEHEDAFIRCDGQTNWDLVSQLTDKAQFSATQNTTYYLGLAYWFTGEERYAQELDLAVSRFFLDADTYMNPHLHHAQLVPGQASGRGFGIIEFRNFVEYILDPLVLVRARNSPSWTDAKQNAMLAWTKEFFEWLQTNTLAMNEKNEKNNHADWYQSLIAGIAMHIDEFETANHAISLMKEHHLVMQFLPSSGLLPFEVARTRSIHYSLFGLEPFLRMVSYGRKSVAWGTATGSIDTDMDNMLKTLQPALNRMEKIATSYSAWPFFDMDLYSGGVDGVQGIADAVRELLSVAASIVEPAPAKQYMALFQHVKQQVPHYDGVEKVLYWDLTYPNQN